MVLFVFVFLRLPPLALRQPKDRQQDRRKRCSASLREVAIRAPWLLPPMLVGVETAPAEHNKKHCSLLYPGVLKPAGVKTRVGFCLILAMIHHPFRKC